MDKKSMNFVASKSSWESRDIWVAVSKVESCMKF